MILGSNNKGARNYFGKVKKSTLILVKIAQPKINLKFFFKPAPKIFWKLYQKKVLGSSTVRITNYSQEMYPLHVVFFLLKNVYELRFLEICSSNVLETTYHILPKITLNMNIGLQVAIYKRVMVLKIVGN